MATDPIEALGRLYADAAEELKKRAVQRLVTDQRRLSKEAFRARLLQAEVDQIINQLDEDVADWIAENAPELYAESIRDTNARLRDLGSTSKAEIGIRPQIHREAVQVIVDNMQDTLQAASQELARGFRRVIRSTQLRSVVDREVKRQIGLGIIEGKARKEVSDQIKERLIAEFSNAPFRVGARTFEAGNYAEMVARTMTREAATAGTVNRLVEIGEDLVIISDSGATDACAFYENQIFSISGNSEKYPALSSIPNSGPPFHPNCTHNLLPFIEELASEREIEKGTKVPDKALGKSFKEVNRLTA